MKKPSPSASPLPRLTAERVLDSAFDLAAKRGWASFSLFDVARHLEVSVLEVERIAPEKKDLIRLLVEDVDAAMLADPLPSDASVRDRLFDLIMRRFDALERRRAGVIALLHSWPKGDALLPASLFGPVRHALRKVLDAAGLAPTALRVMGLGAVMGAVMRVWVRDDTPDKGTTMAALDRHLQQLERAAEALAPLCASRPTSHDM